MPLITSCTPAAVPISVCTNRATACPSGSGERAVVATEAPLRVKRRTIACPMPFVPPVTRTRLPLNSSPDTGQGYVVHWSRLVPSSVEQPESALASFASSAARYSATVSCTLRAMLFLLLAIAQPEVSQDTGGIGSTHEKVR